jgi:hypothetical protein
LESKPTEFGEGGGAASAHGAVDQVRRVTIEGGQLGAEFGIIKIDIDRAIEVAAGELAWGADVEDHDGIGLGEEGASLGRVHMAEHGREAGGGWGDWMGIGGEGG